MGDTSFEKEHINNIIYTKDLLLKQSKAYAIDLKKTMDELKNAHQQLKEAYLETIQRLVLATEYKDTYTGQHVIRMSRISAFIANKIGLPEKDVNNIRYAAPMHDVGKIGIPDYILTKNDKLTREEFDIIKTHCSIGAKILSNSQSEILMLAESIAFSHHEKWDGKGYPLGLSGEEIPLPGRITGLVDVFDALISKRPYKEPYPIKVAYEIIKEKRNEHFDPDLVDIFFDNMDEIKQMYILER